MPAKAQREYVFGFMCLIIIDRNVFALDNYVRLIISRCLVQAPVRWEILVIYLTVLIGVGSEQSIGVDVGDCERPSKG